MKTKVKKIVPPKLPSTEDILKLSKSLTSDPTEQKFICCCLALTLAIAPDNERDMYSVVFYASHFADGFTADTLETLRLWIGGKLDRNYSGDLPWAIVKNFAGSYLFSWQKPLISLALESYDSIKDNIGDELISECRDILCRHALKNTSLDILR